VFVGNNEYKMDFFNLGSRDCLTSGKLSLFVVKTASRLGLLGVLLKIILNIFLPVKLFEMESLKEVIIESKRKNIPVSLDGEVIHLNPPLHYKIHPQSLNLIVPQKKN
jgi:diacylglycerol kinase family enzyme